MFYDSKMVFVNRGWIPRTTKVWSKPEETVTLMGVLTQPERVSFVLVN